jgi:pimeloyl-ACP methyl ester carboxylesterase
MVFFEKSGHLPAYEEPEKYLKVLETFLATDGAAVRKAAKQR